MSDNINENGQFNPYVKKEDVGAANTYSPAENPAVGNHAANGASAAGGTAEAPAENAAFANGAAENPSHRLKTGTPVIFCSRDPSGLFLP